MKKKQVATIVSIATISFLIGTTFNVITMATDRGKPFEKIWEAIYDLQSETSQLRADHEELKKTVDELVPNFGRTSLKVYVRYPNGNEVPTSELNALVIYWDSSYHTVEPVPDNPYTFSNLSSNDYLVEAYVNDMYSHNTGWVYLGSGDSATKNICTPEQGKLKIRALCNDSSTPLSDAYVEIESQYGTVWRSDTTDCDGWTIWFWLQPTNIPPASGEFYRAKVYYDCCKRGESNEITFGSGESREICVTTDAPPP